MKILISNFLFFIVLLSLLAIEKSPNPIYQNDKAGPIFDCPSQNQNKIYRRFPKESLKKFHHCYDFSMDYLIANNLVIAKAKWLKNYKNDDSSRVFLLDALNHGANDKGIYLELAKYQAQEKNWQQAKVYIDKAELEVNDIFRLQIEYHLDSFSEGTDLSLLPYIYKSNNTIKAQVNQQPSSFNLQRVSDGNIEKINGEPSMASSADGENIWLLWTDSGQDLTENPGYHYWSIKSAKSTDGGFSWSYFDMNTLPGQLDRFHFDPMTAYDEINELFYAGGMVKGFSETWGPTSDDAVFLYRWNPTSNSTAGPFKTYEASPDKGWITPDSNGDIYLSRNYGIDKSTDHGESFQRVLTEPFVAPQPRVNNDNCLIVTDINKTARCIGNDLEANIFNFSSIVFSAGDYIPGTFRAYPFTQHALQDNNDIYAVYSDLKNINSNDTTIYMTKSIDDGQSWTDPWVITPDVSGDQFLPWIEIDSAGGIHIAYFDTRNTPQLDSETSARLDLYYSYSNDNGLSWQESRVTPTSFTTPELIWGDYFFTDYISMSVTNDKVYLAFPWSTEPNQMHMYFAKMDIQSTDLIYQNSFE